MAAAHVAAAREWIPFHYAEGGHGALPRKPLS
jgi:hypothetical protein